MSLGDFDASPGGESAGANVLEGFATAQDQRMRERYTAHRTAISVDGQLRAVHDISADGVRMQAPPGSRLLGDEIKGLLVCKAGGADIRVTVTGTIVRVDPDGETVGLQFSALPPTHQDAVNAVIQMMERLEIEASFEQARRPKSSPPMLKAAVAIAVFGVTLGIGALYLSIR